jgi:uncharacterized membrane protein YagU involved in acid resistance
MKWIKTIVIGILATFAMDITMNALMMLFGLSPTNIHPAGAFLYNLGIDIKYLSVLLHYSYGVLWALVFVYAFERQFSMLKALLFAGVLWLFMMLVYSPVIGWGFFGFGNAQLLQNTHPLYLSSTIDYIVLTISVHLAYGGSLGFLSKKFIIT